MRGAGAISSAILGLANAAQFADGPAPSGFHWEFVTLSGVRVTRAGVYVVALVAN